MTAEPVAIPTLRCIPTTTRPGLGPDPGRGPRTAAAVPGGVAVAAGRPRRQVDPGPLGRLGSTERAEPTAGDGRAHVGHADGPEGHRTDPSRTEELVRRRLADAAFVVLPNRRRRYLATKRVIDIVGALALAVVTAPLAAALAVLIRRDSAGPAVFTQERVTSGGRHFRFHKFRTMYVDAHERFPELYDYGTDQTDLDGVFYKLADDPRNTRVGRWLRRTTLDELPNLVDVLTGELSLVGPRPDLPELVARYRPEELACVLTKAGLTGLAQVSGRSLLTVDERLLLDLRYVAHQSTLLDLRILAKTVKVVLAGEGAF